VGSARRPTRTYDESIEISEAAIRCSPQDCAGENRIRPVLCDGLWLSDRRDERKWAQAALLSAPYRLLQAAWQLYHSELQSLRTQSVPALCAKVAQRELRRYGCAQGGRSRERSLLARWPRYRGLQPCRPFPPHERTKYAWARLRERKVDPRDVLSPWLAVEMMIRDDPQSDWRREYRLVQAAKLIHRMAGSSHKRWQHEHNNSKYTTELHKHAANRGLVLRHIGDQLEEIARPLVDAHLAKLQLPKGRAGA